MRLPLSLSQHFFNDYFDEIKINSIFLCIKLEYTIHLAVTATIFNLNKVVFHRFL